MPAKKKTAANPKLQMYEKLVATNPKVTLKGATHPYTSVNGHMFSYLHPSGSMALRLPDEARQKFLAKFKTKLFEAYGVVQKEYVTVPDSLLEDPCQLSQYFEASYAYVASLKPKPTTRKKSS